MVCVDESSASQSGVDDQIAPMMLLTTILEGKESMLSVRLDKANTTVTLTVCKTVLGYFFPQLHFL